ncbi:MAG: MlaD family protein [Candidatus Sumerlaeia bacterium]
MDTSTSISVKVGIFFVVGVLMLIVVSLKTESPKLRARQAYTIHTYFNNVGSLEKGANVTLAGVEVGQVTGFDFDASRGMVRVNLTVDRRYRLPADSTASLRFKSLLGQYYINIAYGTESGPVVADGGEIPAEQPVDLNEMAKNLSEISRDARQFLSSLNENQSDLFGELQSVVRENREDLRNAIRSLSDAAPRLTAVMDDLSTLTIGLRQGRGTIGRMLTDDTLYENLSRTFDNLAEASEQIHNGDGTLHKLFYSSELHDDLKQTLDKIGRAAESAEQLVAETRPDLREFVDGLNRTLPNMEKGMANLAAISEQINSGQGTVGKMVKDEELYNDMKGAVKDVREVFRAGEEQTVLRSVLGVLFGALL